MSEQAECADVMTKSKEEESSGRIEGESLLLPLLQGLLDAPDSNEQTADSGTESGEDFRSGLLVEVQNVLTKLANTLKSDSSDMPSEKRSSLLQLVSRLQSGLSATRLPGQEEKRTSGRFAKRRRQNRHTVGVSSEELENARKLMEEFGLCDTLNVSRAPLQKQNSEGNVLQFRSINKNQVKNTVAKPYGSCSTSNSHSGASSTINTPSDVLDTAEFPNKNVENKLPSVLDNCQYLPKTNKIHCESTQESETDDDTINAKSSLKPSLVLQSNPIYSRPKTPDYLEQKSNNRFGSKKLKMKRANTIDIPKPNDFYQTEEDYENESYLIDKLDRPNSRLNNYLALRGPIRVGRPNNNISTVPAFEPKTESDKKFMAFINKHNDNINKQSQWAQQKSAANDRSAVTNWNSRFGNIKTAFEKATTTGNPGMPNIKRRSARDFWKSTENNAISAENQFYNRPKQGVRTLQEKFEECDKQPQSRSPWDSSDEKNIVMGTLRVDPKKNYMFVPQPLPVNKFSHAPTSAFTAIPKKSLSEEQPVDNQIRQESKLSDIVKYDYKENTNGPLYLYSPKPIQTSPPTFSTNTSPSTTPWTNQINDHKLHKLAASKFENLSRPLSQPEPPIAKPRKLSKENFFVSSYSQLPEHERLSAPYLTRSADKSNTVRKISDQFNNQKVNAFSPNVTDLRNYQPQNYTITYTKPNSTDYQYNQPNRSFSKPERLQSPPKVYQEQPEYTSQQFIQINQPKPIQKNNLPSFVPYHRQSSLESLKEYEAAVSKVMKGPVSHQAVTVQQNAPKGRAEHDMEAAFNLKNALRKINHNDASVDSTVTLQNKDLKNAANMQRTRSYKSARHNTAPDTTNYPSFLVNGKPLSTQSTEIDENGESILTSTFQIPVTLSSTKPETVQSPTRNVLAKSDSCAQISKEHYLKPVVRSKSTHTLAVPTVQFQAGMTKDEILHKKRTVEAYFNGLNETTNADQKTSKSGGGGSTINRKKTSEKVSVHRQSNGVLRSKTLPNIPDLLDESAVEESFEDLFRSNA